VSCSLLYLGFESYTKLRYSYKTLTLVSTEMEKACPEMVK